MDMGKLVRTSLDISFEELTKDKEEEFQEEFDKLSEVSDDAIGHWLKLAKAKGETRDSDKVLLTLIVELHRKVDELKTLIKEEEIKRVSLNLESKIESIGFEVFKLKEELFAKNLKYYGRIDLPTFPKREIPIFFTAIDSKSAKIELIHERDSKDWDSYVTARERAIIREMRAKNG